MTDLFYGNHRTTPENCWSFAFAQVIMFLKLLCYTFFVLIATALIALGWDYGKIFFSVWQLSKDLPHSNLDESLASSSKEASDNE